MARNVNKKRRDQLVIALAGGLSVREAAQDTGVSLRTVYRHLQDEDFRSRVQSVRSTMFEQTLSTLASTGVTAAQTLRDLLQAESESVRLGAARSVLELGGRLRESVEIEERLSNLERILNRE